MRFAPKYTILILSLAISFAFNVGAEEASREPNATTASSKPAQKTNKLLFMYRLFYLPFSVDFREGRNIDEVLPFLGTGPSARLMSAQEMIQLDGEWKQMREGLRAKTLLLSTPVAVDASVKISGKLFSHKLPLMRSAFDRIPISDRVAIAKALEGKPEAVKNGYRQLQYVKSFVKGSENGLFHFFIVSPSWCQSSNEYRMLLETFFKRFPEKGLALHSIILDDPKEKVFDSRVLAELFPNKEKYSHDNVPKFLAYEVVNGKPVVWEEGQALEQLHNRFFGKHRGHFDSKVSLFGGSAVAQKPGALQPRLSSTP